MNSAQLGEAAMVAVIWRFSALSVGAGESGRRMISWREEGGRVKRMGRDILACVWFGEIGGRFGCRWS
jgi:hypothetical protein